MTLRSETNPPSGPTFSDLKELVAPRDPSLEHNTLGPPPPVVDLIKSLSLSAPNYEDGSVLRCTHDVIRSSLLQNNK